MSPSPINLFYVDLRTARASRKLFGSQMIWTEDDIAWFCDRRRSKSAKQQKAMKGERKARLPLCLGLSRFYTQALFLLVLVMKLCHDFWEAHLVMPNPSREKDHFKSRFSPGLHLKWWEWWIPLQSYEFRWKWTFGSYVLRLRVVSRFCKAWNLYHVGIRFKNKNRKPQMLS